MHAGIFGAVNLSQVVFFVGFVSIFDVSVYALYALAVCWSVDGPVVRRQGRSASARETEHSIQMYRFGQGPRGRNAERGMRKGEGGMR